LLQGNAFNQEKFTFAKSITTFYEPGGVSFGVGKWQDESGGNRDILELEIMD
jgi:hypothetical protein